MGNLKLITTEKFGNLDCNFYRNMNDDILLTREQIGTALEYSNPSKAIVKIHGKYKDRLEPLCIRIVENRLPKNGGAGVNVETVYYTQRGVMEICRWSRQPLASVFMDWVWDIVEKYRNKELRQDVDMKPIIDSMATITDTVTTLVSSMITLQNDVAELKQFQSGYRLPEKHHASAFFKKMWPKYKMLMEYFHCDIDKLYHSIYMELEDMYDVDIDQMYEDYCYKNGLSKNECYRMDVIEHDADMRESLILLINDALVKCGLQTEDQMKKSKRTTLFDRIPA